MVGSVIERKICPICNADAFYETEKSLFSRDYRFRCLKCGAKSEKRYDEFVGSLNDRVRNDRK